MKILHTADIHIRATDDDRWKALQSIIKLAALRQVDALVISGDLFDSNTAALNLRGKMRELFSSLPCPAIIISGNHDDQAYPDGAFLGDQVHLIRDLLRPVKIGNVHFWGFPYEDLLEEEILEYLHLAAGHATPNATNILLFHGELLDLTHHWAQYGDEGKKRYLPVKLSFFASLPWQYILAGHFHTNFDIHEFAEDRFFVYPGSPISITRRELGPRKANLFNTGEPPAPLELQTPYYEHLEIKLSPFEHSNPLLNIGERLHHLPEHANILLDITGYFNGELIDMTEEDLHRAIQKFTGRRIETGKMDFHDIREILEDELFQAFMQRLDKRQMAPESRQEVLNMAMMAMMESRP